MWPSQLAVMRNSVLRNTGICVQYSASEYTTSQIWIAQRKIWGLKSSQVIKAKLLPNRSLVAWGTQRIALGAWIFHGNTFHFIWTWAPKFSAFSSEGPFKISLGSSLVKSSLFWQGSPISHRLVLKGVLHKIKTTWWKFCTIIATCSDHENNTWINSGFNYIQTHDLCNTSVVPLTTSWTIKPTH